MKRKSLNLSVGVSHIEESLKKAQKKKEDRKEILKTLFNQLIERIDESYKERLEIQKISYFYEIVGIFNLRVDFGPYESELISEKYFHCVYSLLSFRSVFENISKSKINTFLKGCNSLFWNDITGGRDEKEFKIIYLYLRKYVRENKLERPIFSDFLGMMFKYFFFYSSSKSCENFIRDIHELNKRLFTLSKIKNLNDLFMGENIILLRSLGDEENVVSLLKKFENLKPLLSNCSYKIKNKVKVNLYMLTRPRGTSLKIRAAAEASLDSLFPLGKYPRFILKELTRCLYDLSWPISLFRWVVTLPKTLTYSFLFSFPFVKRFFPKKMEFMEAGNGEDEQTDDEIDLMFVY